ncbi:MAG: hypothetical protein WC346_14240 [Methanogenium sp.]|jgi:predicted transcriptional regulator
MPIKKTIPESKIIKGEIYLLAEWARDREWVNQRAEKIRKEKGNARIIKTTFGIWGIYYKPKRLVL